MTVKQCCDFSYGVEMAFPGCRRAWAPRGVGPWSVRAEGVGGPERGGVACVRETSFPETLRVDRLENFPLLLEQLPSTGHVVPGGPLPVGSRWLSGVLCLPGCGDSPSHSPHGSCSPPGSRPRGQPCLSRPCSCFTARGTGTLGGGGGQECCHVTGCKGTWGGVVVPLQRVVQGWSSLPEKEAPSLRTSACALGRREPVSCACALREDGVIAETEMSVVKLERGC